MMPRDPVLWYAWALLVLTTLFGGTWLLDAIAPLIDNEPNLATTHEQDKRPFDSQQFSDTARGTGVEPVVHMPQDRKPALPSAERECAPGRRCS